jgi:HSP20 family protein
MTVVRWSPWREFEGLERWMWPTRAESGQGPALVPAADVYETADEFVVELEVPGYEERELEIDVLDHTLRVKGQQRAASHEKEEKGFHLPSLHLRGQAATEAKQETTGTAQQETLPTEARQERVFHLRERLGMSFERHFTLPVEANLDRTSASVGNGVLEIHVAKTGQPKPRTVAINK